MRKRRIQRRGYTLLEVLLAAVIAVIMMAALYVAMEVQLRQMEEGRTQVEKSTVARAIFNRISMDTASSLSPEAPTGSSASSSPMSTTAATTTTDTSTTSTLTFNIGVKGDANTVAIYQTRVGRAVITPPDDGSGNQNPTGCDIRRIYYFLAGSGDGGLARQEIRLVTSDRVDDTPTDVDDYTKVVAEEVKQFDLRYFDGSSWQTSWDGSTPGPDGKTPQGPPRAIEITIGVKVDGTDQLKTYKHVIAFEAAPGASSSSQGTTTSGNP